MLILLDNVDGHCDGSDKQYEFSQLMKEILNIIPLKSNVKFLMTLGKKLSNTHVSNERNLIFNGQMLEQELKPLIVSDTVGVLRRVSYKSEKELPESVCRDIHAVCGGIPLSVRMVGDLLKNGYTPEKLLSCLQRQPQFVTVDMFLQKSFQMLDPLMYELKILLVRFSVFQTARFDIDAALDVGLNTLKDEVFRRPYRVFSGTEIKDEAVKVEMEQKLQQLKCHFLLEIEDAQSSMRRKRKSAENLYSLHPLVANYISSLCKEDENLKLERESAKLQFLKFYGKVTEKLGEQADSDPLECRIKMEANLIHIKQFFTIIRQDKALLTEYLPQKDPNKHKRSCKVTVQRRRIWKIAELAISSLGRKLFARRQAELEQERKNLYSYIYWRSLEADSLLVQDRTQQALDLFDSVTSELAIANSETVCSNVDGWYKVEDEEAVAWATFYMVKGRLYFMTSRNNNEKWMYEAMVSLTLAENLFEGRAKSIRNKKQIKCEIMPSQADTLRNRAEIYYKQDQLEKALEDGKHVLKIVKNLYVAPHIEISLALERLAYYHLKLGSKKQKDLDEEGQTHLEKAMQFYDEVMIHITNGGLPIEYNNARTYRHIRDNHIKVMRILRYENRLVEERVRQYQAFEEGKYNKKILQNLQHDLDFEPAEFIQKAIEDGVKFIPQKMDDSDDESSESSSSKASHSSSCSSKSSSQHVKNPNRMMDVDHVIALKRRDSGVEEDEMSDEEMTDQQLEVSGMEVGETDMETFKHDHNDHSKRKQFRRKSSVTKHVSNDLPDVRELDEVKGEMEIVELREPFLTRRLDSGRDSWTSAASTSSFESHRNSSATSKESWRSSIQSSSFESHKRFSACSITESQDSAFSGTQKNRERFSHSGSQDSVTSQMGKMLNLNDEESEDDDEIEQHSTKRKKTDPSC